MKYLITYGSIQKNIRAKSKDEALDRFAVQLGFKSKEDFLWYSRSGFSIKEINRPFLSQAFSL